MALQGKLNAKNIASILRFRAESSKLALFLSYFTASIMCRLDHTNNIQYMAF